MNYKLLLAYDGSRYRGWQRLGDSEMTIQGKLEAVLSKMVQAPIEVVGSGRTDAGVHAQKQVANFHCETQMTCNEIKDYLNHYLPEDIGIISVEEVEERFHSRYMASEKTYQYRIWNSDKPCVFSRKYVWKLQEELNVALMNEAAQEFIGTHDYLAFCSNKHFKKSSIRTITSFAVVRQEDEVIFTVTGDGFLHNMVRIMVGTLLSVSRGELQIADIAAIRSAKIRSNAGMTVPPQGLCLVEVRYR